MKGSARVGLRMVFGIALLSAGALGTAVFVTSGHSNEATSGRGLAGSAEWPADNKLAGVTHEEVGGVLTIPCAPSCGYELNLAEAASDSELGAFRERADFGKRLQYLTVTLTPGFEGEVWHVKDDVRGAIRIFAVPVAPVATVEVSYRLRAPRAGSLPQLTETVPAGRSPSIALRIQSPTE
jgi:hypothetical protein